MKKYLYFVIVLIFLLSACSKNNSKTAYLEANNIGNWAKENVIIDEDLIMLPYKHPEYDVVFTWSIDEDTTYHNLKIEDGVIFLDGDDYDFVLIVSFVYKGNQYQKSRKVIINAQDVTSVIARAFIKQFVGGVISRDYDLKTTYPDYDGSIVTWTSSRPDLFTNEGKYFAPFNDEELTLSYSVSTTKPKQTKTYTQKLRVLKMKESLRTSYIENLLDAFFEYNILYDDNLALPSSLNNNELFLTWQTANGEEITKLADISTYIIPHVGIDLVVLVNGEFKIKYRLMSPAANQAAQMRIIPSIDLIKEMKVGFNIGNTLDAPSETSWGNMPITFELVQTIKDAGFNIIRIPVTWEGKFSFDDEFLIDEAYLDRVQEVINYAIDDNTYVILNMHHEKWNSTTYENAAYASLIMEKLWKQIGTRFANYDEHLLFEGMNEPRNYLGTEAVQWSGNSESFAVINILNHVFVKTVRSLGGNNLYRHLLITTNGAGTSEAIIASLDVPNDPYVIVSVHSYAPYDFAHDKTTVTTWSKNNPNHTSPISSVFTRLNNYFISKGIAVIMGEFASRDKQNIDSRMEWLDYYLNLAHSLGIPCIWWDAGQSQTVENMTFSILNRYSLEWIFPEIVKRLMQ